MKLRRQRKGPTLTRATCSHFGNVLWSAAMRVLGIPILLDFTTRHPPARQWVQAWTAEAQSAVWSTPQDVKNRYRTVSFVNRYVIFNVKGNDYRMVTIITYRSGIVVVQWIGTHNDYMKFNWESEANEGSSRKD